MAEPELDLFEFLEFQLNPVLSFKPTRLADKVMGAQRQKTFQEAESGPCVSQGLLAVQPSNSP